MDWQRDIEVLTPLFNRGAYQDTPELRVPSIRGMVRWWFRALGGSADEEKEAFGGMKKFGQRLAKEVTASRLVFRVKEVQASPSPSKVPTLPHKQGGQASPQAAFLSDAQFQLQVFSRFGPLPGTLKSKVENALEAWLLLGALGLRANRSGGNVWPSKDAPATPAELRKQLDSVGCRWPVYLTGPEIGSSVELLRAAATDTVEGTPWVFGMARGREREASPLKFKIVRLEDRLRLLVTAKDERTILEAKRLLVGHRSRPETWVKVEAN
ncbi:MAG TPA: type III-B CRISPR module RAMP protein Cmr1 [Candidatus Limnocylindria bacterium]|jgi:CRISPR/Cas system CMR-associated protein Cmr1 (group 7 of RAMP superfamily)|nr:type III-B CRISPR module RAMP protein Cmr1 [Candidatus Limnocylindria bacterium]